MGGKIIKRTNKETEREREEDCCRGTGWGIAVWHEVVRAGFRLYMVPSE